MFQGLKTKTITLSGNVITVSEASNSMAEDRGDIVAELMLYNDSLKGKAPKKGQPKRRSNLLINVYSALKACSTGDLPTTPEEFNEQMKDEDIQTWLDLAHEMNPHWFKWMDDAEKILTEAEQKTEKKKKGSTTQK